MRFYKDAPNVTTPVIWYAVPWDRTPLDTPTIFTSSDWDDQIQLPPLGEVKSSMQWWAGRPPPFLPLGKPGRCGSPEQWATGVLTTDPVPALNPQTGGPACCGRAVPIFPAGVAEGAAELVAVKLVADAGEVVGAESSDPTHVTVACCPNPLPWAFSVLIEATGVWAFLDGSTFSQGYGHPTPTPGALGWQGTWTDATMGDATLLVWCAPGFGWLFRWSGWITSDSIGADAGTVCDPFKLVATIGYIFAGSNIRAIVQGFGPASWSGGPAAAVGPGGTFTFPPSWSGGPAAAVGPGGTFTVPAIWSGGPAAAVGPGGTLTPWPSWSGGPAAAVGPGGTFTFPAIWSGGPAAAVGPGGTFTHA